MKTAVVYYSMSGHTEATAKKIAALLGADLIKVEPVKAYPDKGFKKFMWGGKSALMGDRPKLLPYGFDADKYDTVVIGTPVWAGTFTPPIRTFISENEEALRTKRIAAFVCIGGDGAEKALGKLAKFMQRDGFAAQLGLTDPELQSGDGVDEKIAAFCEKLK
ncbi:MAG: flavodoxin [Clostridia bacterium]|nr:flavodoxin [Clostridia bacterium]